MLISCLLAVNEAEVADPWEDPDPVEEYPRRKEPTVRFA